MPSMDLLVMAGPLVGEKRRVKVDAEDLAGVLAALGKECGVPDRGPLAVSLVVAGSERAEPVADIADLGAKAKVSLRLASDFSPTRHGTGSCVELCGLSAAEAHLNGAQGKVVIWDSAFGLYVIELELQGGKEVRYPPANVRVVADDHESEEEAVGAKMELGRLPSMDAPQREREGDRGTDVMRPALAAQAAAKEHQRTEAVQAPRLAAPGRAAKARASPRWIPSAETVACMHCSTEFGFTRQRHHCRHCGWAVCDSCSPQKLQLNRWLENEKPHTLREGPSPSTLRVCTSCAQALVAPQPKVEPEPNLQRPPAPLPLPQPELQVRSTVCFSVCQSGAHPSATTGIGVAVWSGA
jgi:hypothetical protein